MEYRPIVQLAGERRCTIIRNPVVRVIDKLTHEVIVAIAVRVLDRALGIVITLHAYVKSRETECAHVDLGYVERIASQDGHGDHAVATDIEAVRILSSRSGCGDDIVPDYPDRRLYTQPDRTPDR